jgi:DNA-binding XRE family transcriptional regulator
MKIKLDSMKVENQRRRVGWSPKDIAAFLGITRQGYLDMLKRQSASRSQQLAKLFSIDEDEIVRIEK